MSHSKELRKSVEIRKKIAEKELELLRLEEELAGMKEKKKAPKRKRDKGKEKEKEKGAETPIASAEEEEEEVIRETKRRKARSRWFDYRYKDGEKEKRFKVGDFSSNNDHSNYLRMNAAKKEQARGEFGPSSRLVVDVLKEGLRRGHNWLDDNLVPNQFKNHANEELRAELDPVDFDRLVRLETEESSLSESFDKSFEEWDISPAGWALEQEVTQRFQAAVVQAVEEFGGSARELENWLAREEQELDARIALDLYMLSHS